VNTATGFHFPDRETNKKQTMTLNNIPFRAAAALTAGVTLALLAGCASKSCCSKTTACPMNVNDGGKLFGFTQEGTPVKVYALHNKNGVEADILTYGGIIQSLKVPDKNGKFGDVVLGYDYLSGYETNSPYFGALIGRYGNRIARGHFTLDGVGYQIATNNVPNTLHGGFQGFDKHVWKAKPGTSDQGQTLELTYVSHDGDEGYPGKLTVTALYTLTEDNSIRLDYTAASDRDTVVNLTQHSYWNLACQGDILGHLVYINSDKFTPVDETLIPTGELKPVDGTPFDFRTATAVGARVGQDDEQLKFGRGYDHNWVINHPMGELGLDARVTEPTTGRVMEVWSTEPGLQFYCGNFLDGTITGKEGRVYQFRNAIVMEPQHFPDSPNHDNFPSTVLHPGETYHNTIIYKFLTN
jgi:aldose 1-epimerase